MLLKGVLSRPRPIPRIVQRLDQPAEISLEGGLGSAKVIVFPFCLVHKRCCFHKFFGERSALRALGIVWADQARWYQRAAAHSRSKGLHVCAASARAFAHSWTPWPRPEFDKIMPRARYPCLAECAYCGEETRLFYHGTPVCLTCCDLPTEERERRREAAQQKQSSEQTKTKKAPSKPKPRAR
jgi:hypothetical protein